jgi:hypothetical protein
MWFQKVINLIKKSGKASGKPKVVYLSNTKMNSRKNVKTGHDKREEWASHSGLYRKLSEPQKKKLDQIIAILDKEDLDR